MSYPRTARVRAAHVEGGVHRLVSCSVASIPAVEERDEVVFGNRLVELVLEREPTIKTVHVLYEDGEELEIAVVVSPEVRGQC